MTRYSQPQALLVILAVLLLSWTLAGQTGPTAANPPKDDPELYSSFFFFMEGFSDWLDQRGAAASAKKAKFMESAARYFEIDVADLVKLSAACRSAAADLRKLAKDVPKGGIDPKGRSIRPSDASLRDFAPQRQAAIQAAIDQVRTSLSQAGWNKVKGHINGAHRASVTLTANPNGPH